MGRSAKEMMIMPLCGNGDSSDNRCQSLLENETTVIEKHKRMSSTVETSGNVGCC